MQASGAIRAARSPTHIHLSSSALCAIAHWGGRSSIPEASVIESMSRSVLDAPPSRGMTVVVALRHFTVIASGAKQSISPHEERMDCFASLAMTVKCRSNTTTVIPAHAGIRYAAAYRFYH